MTLFKTNPKDIKFSSTLINDVDDTNYFTQNTFLIFQSLIDDIYYLVYANKSNSIISYNIFKNQKKIKLKCINKNYKEEFISCFKHISDLSNNRDLLMTINAAGNIIKVWNFSNFSLTFKSNNTNKNS